MTSSSRSKATNSNRTKRRRKTCPSTTQSNGELSLESTEQEKLQDTLGSKLSTEKTRRSETKELCKVANFEHEGTPENTPSLFVSKGSLQRDSETGVAILDVEKCNFMEKAKSLDSLKVNLLPELDKISYSSESQVSEEDTITVRRRMRQKNIEVDLDSSVTSISDIASSFVSALFRLKCSTSFRKGENGANYKPAASALEESKQNDVEERLLFQDLVETIFPTCLKHVSTQIHTEDCPEKIFSSSTEFLPKNAEELWKWTPTKLLTAPIREWQLSFLEYLETDIGSSFCSPLPHGRLYRFKWLKEDAILMNIDNEESKKCIKELLQSYYIRSFCSLCHQTSIEDILLRDGYLTQENYAGVVSYPSLKEAVKSQDYSLSDFEYSRSSKGFESCNSSERLSVLPKSSEIEASKHDNIGELKHNHRKGTSCPACHARTSARHRTKDASEVSWKGSSNFVLKWLDSVVSKQCDVCHHGINEGLDDGNSPGLVFASCIICGATVHALCYGVQEDDDILLSSMKGLKRFFLCSPCSEESFMTSCVICGRKGGALKRTEGGTFAHLYCALWTPKVFVRNIQLMEPVVNLESAKSTAPNGTCIFCLKENTGITVSCAFPDCSQCFHVYCARESGQKPHVVSEAEGVYRFLMFCSSHKLSHHHSSSSKDDINAILNTLQPRILKKSKKSSLFVEDVVRECPSKTFQNRRNENSLFERNETGMFETHLRFKKKDWSAATLFKLQNIGKPRLLNYEIISSQQIDRFLFSSMHSNRNRNDSKVCSDEIWVATQKTFEKERVLYERHKDLIKKMVNILKDAYYRENNLKTELKREKRILISLKGIQKVRKTVDANRSSCLRHGGVISVKTAQKRLRELLQDSAAMKEAKEDVSPGESNSQRRRTQVIRNAAAKISSLATPIKLKPVFKEEDNFEYFAADLPQELTACCSVCGSGECEEIGNDIILCDGCHIAVHQTCYGVHSIPEGDWFCSSCVAVGTSNKDSLEVATSSLGYRYPKAHEVVPDPYRCILCPMVGGALKPTADARKWAHVSCAMWLPETYFENPEAMEPILGFEKVIAERWNLKCSVCNQRNVGPCIQCTLRHCGRAFHVSCGLSAGLHMGIKEDSSKGAGVSLVALCPKHSRAHFSATEHSRIVSLRKRRRSSLVSNETERCQRQTSTNLQYKDDFMGTLFSDESNKFEYGNTQVMSALESGDDISLHLERLEKLRQNLEELRTLCDLVRKREHLKRGLMLVAFKVYSQQFSESFGNFLNRSDYTSEKAAVKEVQHGRKYRQKPLKLRLRGGSDTSLCEKPQSFITGEEGNTETSVVSRGSRSGMVGAVAASAAAAVRAAGAAFRLHRNE